MTPPSSQIGYLELLRGNSEFRSLFFGRVVSLFGDWFNTLAVIALLRELGGLTAGSFAWVLIFKTLPTLFASPLAGVIADRFSRRRVMIASDLARAAAVAAMFGLIWYPSLTALYALVLLQTTLSTFFEPARRAILPEIVPPRALTAANALGAATWSSMLTLGAAAGGIVTAWLGWEIALGVDALSYLVSAALLTGLRERGAPPRGADGAGGADDWAALLGIRDIREGIAYVAGRPRVLTLMLVKTGWTLPGSILLTLTLLGEQVFLVAGEAMLGVSALYVARGLGTGVGPFLARWISRSEPAAMERLITWGFAIGGFFYLGVASVDTILAAIPLVVLAHIGGGIIWVFSTIRLQQLVPSEVRGRVFAAELAAFTTTTAATTWIYGGLIDAGALAIRDLPLLLGAGLLCAAALWWGRGRRWGWAQP